MIPPQSAIGTLMHEHRLIMRMVADMRRELDRVAEERDIAAAYVDTALDFLRTYADRCHHGKEEDILFRELASKPLTAEDAAAMQGLIDDHAWARARTRDVAEAATRYFGGGAAALAEVTRALSDLADFYPVHIDKEDRGFFRAAAGYFSAQERDVLAREFHEFDRLLIEEKYRRVVEELESRRG